MALVTGGADGIGEAIARRFLAEGAGVLIVARRPPEAVRILAEDHRGACHYLRADVARPGTADQAVELAIARLGRLDVLVNNAAFQTTAPFALLELDDLRRALDVNVVAACAMMLACSKAMPRGGSIINITSRLAAVAVPQQGAYGVSKAALLSLTRYGAVELGPHGIRVNAIAPGLTETPTLRPWIEDAKTRGEWAELLERIPQGRIAEPDDVASAALYLASDESAHVTGASLAVDGGFTAT